jgi:hypothetical protein
MTHTLRATAAAAALFVSLCGAAVAQAPAQIVLTEKQVQSFIAAQPAIGAITDKMQGSDKPDPKTQAQLDDIAKKNGFANFAEYDDVASNISMVIVGIDPQTKTFRDPRTAIQRDIAEVTADKSMPAAEKQKMLDELNEALKSAEPIQNQGNIALVLKYYDKLQPMMQTQ